MEDLILHVVIQPKASRDAFAGILNGELKITITAPPVDGKANEHLRRFLSRQFRTAAGNVTILRGETGRHKTVKITGAREIPEDYLKITGAQQ